MTENEKKLDAGKISEWLTREENLLVLSEVILVELCASHEDGGETCWGRDGHIWLYGAQQIPAICHPRAEVLFSASELD